MGKKVQRVSYQLDPKGIKRLSHEEIVAILRGTDDLIMQGGRSLLAKILRGSREKKVLKLQLDQSPVYGYYQHISLSDILARIDWVILNNYLALEYDYRLPLLVYTPTGWAIEIETYATELLQGFDEMLADGRKQFDLTYLKDKHRGLIMLLLDKVEASGDKKYIPLLETWAKIDYKKVKQRIREVINQLNQAANY